MEAGQFGSALRTRPFQPFTIRTSGGAEYAVAHPGLANIGVSGRTVVVLEGGETVVVLDTASITEFLIKPTGKGKGKSKDASGSGR